MEAFEQAAKGLEGQAAKLSRAADKLADDRIGDQLLIRTNAATIQGLSQTMDRMAAAFDAGHGNGAPTP